MAKTARQKKIELLSAELQKLKQEELDSFPHPTREELKEMHKEYDYLTNGESHNVYYPPFSVDVEVEIYWREDDYASVNFVGFNATGKLKKAGHNISKFFDMLRVLAVDSYSNSYSCDGLKNWVSKQAFYKTFQKRINALIDKGDQMKTKYGPHFDWDMEFCDR